MDRHVPGPVGRNRVVTGYGQLVRLTLQRAAQHSRELDEHITRCTERIAQHRRAKANVRRASELIGIGPITASAAVARRRLQTVQERLAIRRVDGPRAATTLQRRQQQPGGINKHGPAYLRALFVHARQIKEERQIIEEQMQAPTPKTAWARCSA